ncbi:MAG: NFACT family protein [Candidatus Micrarchaeota archaeon]
MQKMSNLDYYFAVEEMQKLKGGYLNKAYEPRQGVIRLKFHRDGEVNLLAELGVRMHPTKYIEESAGEPSVFAAFLRSGLENAKVVGVRQLNFDRIVAIDFEKKRKYSLVFEMFARGNTVLCDENGHILKVYNPEIFSSRKLRQGELYSPPPNPKKHSSEVAAADLAGLKGKAVSVLSKVVNLPPFYLEEACARAGIPLDAPFEGLSDADVRRLLDELKSLTLEKPDPSVYSANGRVSGFSPFPLEKLRGSGLEMHRYPSFSEALDEFYANALPEPEKDRGMEKLSAVLSQQNAAVASLEEESVSAKSSGDEIYRNSALYDEIIAEANALLKRKMPEKEAAAALEKRFGRKIRLECGSAGAWKAFVGPQS